MLALRKYRSKEPGWTDVLNFAAVVDDGVVLNKDGSLMAGWFYQGSDISSSTAVERNAVAVRINAALARLGSGWMSHIDAIRFQARDYPAESASFFPDPISRLIDQERRTQFEKEGAHYESMYALVVTYMPPLAARSGISRFMFDEPEKKSDATRTLEQFKSDIDALEDALSTVLRLQRMKMVKYVDEFGVEHTNDEFLQYLNYTVTGDSHPVNLPDCPMYLDALIGGGEFFHGLTPKLNHKLISVVAIDGYPLESTPGILAALDKLPISYRWSTRFIYLDAEDAKKHIGRFRRKWQQQARTLLDQILNTNRAGVNRDATAKVEETEEASGEASNQSVAFGFITTAIVLMGERRAELDDSARVVVRAIQNLGFGSRIETVNRTEAFLGSIPGHSYPNIRRPMVHTMNLAHLIPTATIWAGRENAPCPFYPQGSPPLLHAATEGSTPFRLNLHVGDVGHTLIFGPTGAGKSVLLAFLAAQFRRYPNAQVFAFDKGRSMFALTRACRGKHFEMATDDGEAHLMPLADIDTDADQAWAEEWIETCVALQLKDPRDVTPAHRNAIHTAMTLLRAAPRAERDITSFVTNVQDKELKEALKYYTLTGAGKMLDQRDESLQHSSFETYEIEELMNRGDKIVIPVLLYMFRRIAKRLNGQPTMLLLDEAWMMLGNPVFRDKIREWLKVMRKANCLVVLATQSLSDAVRSGILDVLMESCPTKILLPNEQAGNAGRDGTGPRALYELMGLNERQIEIITEAVPKRQYYFLSTEGRRLVNLNLGPVALAFTGVSAPTDIAVIRELERAHGDNWPAAWLQKRGVTVPANYFSNN